MSPAKGEPMRVRLHRGAKRDVESIQRFLTENGLSAHASDAVTYAVRRTARVLNDSSRPSNG